MPTKIYLMPSKKSEQEILEYVSSNSLNPPERLHSTIIYTTETPIFRRDPLIKTIEDLLPITLNPSTYSLDLFGEEDTLVLRYVDERVSRINYLTLNEAFRQMIVGWLDFREEEFQILREYASQRRTSTVYQDFNPHITLSKCFQEKATRDLLVYQNPIILDTLLWTL